MVDSDGNGNYNPLVTQPSIANATELNEAVGFLDVLRIRSIRLRDLYHGARWQTAEIRFRDLHLLSESHYQEQAALAHALADRIHVLNGAHRESARDCLPQIHAYRMHHCLSSAVGWLLALIDAHNAAIRAAAGRPSALTDAADPRYTAAEFVVGRVVLSNDLQCCSVRERLTALAT